MNNQFSTTGEHCSSVTPELGVIPPELCNYIDQMLEILVDDDDSCELWLSAMHLIPSSTSKIEPKGIMTIPFNQIHFTRTLLNFA